MYIKDFQVPRDLIDMAIRGFATGLIFHGKGGLGKSFTTVTECKEKCPKRGRKYVYHAGYMSGKQSYEYLKRYNGCVIILDDLVDLLADNRAISMLNAALWAPAGDKRIVQYTTTKNDGSTGSIEFEFDGSLILLINEIPRQRRMNVQAMVSRVFTYEFKLTNRQIVDISVQILRDDSFYNLIKLELSEEDREQIINDFVENTSLYTKNFSLREMRRFVMCYTYCKAAYPQNPTRYIELYKATTEIDEELTLVYDLMHSGKSVTNQIVEFFEKTGKSRATFFRKKRAIRDEEDFDKKHACENFDKKQDDISKHHQNSISRSIIDSEETADPFSDKTHQSESNDTDTPATRSEEITVNHFLDKIHGSDLEIENLGMNYFRIKYNGFALNYVKKTESGIEVRYLNNGTWKTERIRTNDQLSAAINKTNEIRSKSIQEKKNLAIPAGHLNDCLSYLEISEPKIKIKKCNGTNKYNIIIDNDIIVEISRRKDGKLNLKWVTETEMKGMIINGEKDYHKAAHRIKEYIDIYKNRLDVDKYL